MRRGSGWGERKKKSGKRIKPSTQQHLPSRLKGEAALLIVHCHCEPSLNVAASVLPARYFLNTTLSHEDGYIRRGLTAWICFFHQNIYVYASSASPPSSSAHCSGASALRHPLVVEPFCFFLIRPPPPLPGGFRCRISCCCLFHTWATFVFSFSIPRADTDPYIKSLTHTHTRACPRSLIF